MIFSTTQRFIFIHVPKAAGTSINAALSPHDVFHPVRTADAATKRAFAQTAGVPPALVDLGTHGSAAQVIALIGADVFAGYFSFAFVRNPWDVAVSWFHYRLINPHVPGHKEAAACDTFARYIDRHIAAPGGEHLVGLQHPFVTNTDGALALNFIGRYESFDADYAAVMQRLNVQTLELDRLNQSYHAPWAQLYTRDTFAMIGKLVAKDASLFGYATDPDAYGIK
jgi:hypothetical protein